MTGTSAAPSPFLSCTTAQSPNPHLSFVSILASLLVCNPSRLFQPCFLYPSQCYSSHRAPKAFSTSRIISTSTSMQPGNPNPYGQPPPQQPPQPPPNNPQQQQQMQQLQFQQMLAQRQQQQLQQQQQLPPPQQHQQMPPQPPPHQQQQPQPPPQMHQQAPPQQQPQQQSKAAADPQMQSLPIRAYLDQTVVPILLDGACTPNVLL